MSKVRVRVESRQVSTHEDRDVAFKRLFAVFKKTCSEAGVMHEYKKHEFYESKSRKIRRKKREAELFRLKAKLKENFPQKVKPKGKSNYAK